MSDLMHYIALSVCLSLLVAENAHSQEPAGIPVSEVLALEVGQQLRMDTRNAGPLQGRFAFSSDTTLTIVRDAVPVSVRLMDVERLWLKGRSTGRGALIGAIAGLVAGATYGLLIADVACAETDCTRGEVAAVIGLVGGAGGAVVGAAVGAAIPRWRLRFPVNF